MIIMKTLYFRYHRKLSFQQEILICVVSVKYSTLYRCIQLPTKKSFTRNTLFIKRPRHKLENPQGMEKLTE